MNKVILFISLLFFAHNICASQETSEGIKTVSLGKTPLFHFIRTELKRPEYAREILPYDFSYVHQLLVYGKEVRDPQEYARSVFSIFSNVMGASHDISAYAFASLLELLPTVLTPYSTHSQFDNAQNSIDTTDLLMHERFKTAVFNTLYTQFSSQYDVFKAQPVPFFDDLAARIALMAKQELDMQHMRTAIKRFIELGLSKVTWRPEQPDTLWPNVKSIAQHLMLLAENNIIDDLNDLDDMYWTLIHRFNYFIDLFSAHLPESFYQEIKNDVTSGTPLLLTLAEQDTCIQTKKECLMRALMEAEAQTVAHGKGILLS